MSQLTILYDNWCPKCTKFSKVVRKIDIFNRIVTLKLRETPPDKYSMIDFAKAEKEMPSFDKNCQVYYGFDTLYRINVALPALWILLPITYLLKVSTLGRRGYREIATNRKLLLHCSGNCQLPS